MSHVKKGQQICAARGREVKVPTFPAAFAKFTSGITTVDYEIELASVIGRPALCVSEEDALSHVAGYTVFNDAGTRELQMPEMESQIGITMSKSFPGLAPTGPWLVTADEIPDPQALMLEHKVNGASRQCSGHDLFRAPHRLVLVAHRPATRRHNHNRNASRRCAGHAGTPQALFKARGACRSGNFGHRHTGQSRALIPSAYSAGPAVQGK